MSTAYGFFRALLRGRVENIFHIYLSFSFWVLEKFSYRNVQNKSYRAETMQGFFLEFSLIFLIFSKLRKDLGSWFLHD